MSLYPLLRLEAPGFDPFIIDESAGLYGQTLDLGDAVTRAVAEDAVNADGSIDTTAYHGARNITLKVTAAPKPDGSTLGFFALRQRFRQFTHPRLRPLLYVTQSPDAPEQLIMLRRSQFSDVITDPKFSDITVQWIAPYGILESSALYESVIGAGSTGVFTTTLGVQGTADQQGVSGYPAGTILGVNEVASVLGPLGGRVYPLTYDRTYAPGGVVGEGTITTLGDADSNFVARIYGPCTDPIIENETIGKSLVLLGLTIAAGNFLELNTRTCTVRMNGDAGDSRYDRIDFTTSQWWTLAPGLNTIRFNPGTSSAPSNVTFVYRDSYL